MNPANKAWYWLAAGVMALGLNGYYQDGGFQGLHRLASCTSTVIAKSRSQFRQIATQGEVMPAEPARCMRPAAKVMVSGQMILPQAQVGIPLRTQVRLAQLQERLQAMEVARVQARMDRLQQVMVRRAQVELRNGQIHVLTDHGQVQVAMPSLPGVEVNVQQGPVQDTSDPD